MSVSTAFERALQMIDDGADWIDIGGESTRPDALPVTEKEELGRVLPVIQKIRQHSKIPISIDTTKASVAKAALEAGANLINDVSALSLDSQMIEVAKKFQTKVILMHRRGNPQTMQSLASYKNVATEVTQELEQKVNEALAKGISAEQIWIDPGFGFSKTAEQNWELLHRIKNFKKMGFPVVVGLSRKSFMEPKKNPKDRLLESLVSGFYAALQGVDILRVHDVVETRQMLNLAGKLLAFEQKLV